MNSNGFVEVNKVWCNQCQNPFYELSNYELEECPHCKKPLNAFPDVEHTYTVRIEADYKTGKVSIIEK